MKLTFKYIIVKTGAILFNEGTSHIAVGHGFKEMKWDIFAAGFCVIEFNQMSKSNPISVKCYGESDSLKIPSIPAVDEVIVGDLFNQISQIKYFALDVKELYDAAGQ